MSSSVNEYYFDERAAAIAVAFFEKLLVHTKGDWAGGAFKLQPWQRDEIIRPLFGWKRADGTRRYRRAYIEIPRKNGKSTLCAGIALLLLFADGEAGAEVYSAAADRDQASIVFDSAKTMAEASPQLIKRCKPFKRSIVVPESNSFYRVLSADAYTKHGLNAHGIVFDELHAQPNRELYDVLNTSTGARKQPMMVMITTAGYDRNSICWEQHDVAKRVLEARRIGDAANDDPELFVFIAAADEGDDWTDESVWAKANPGLGVTVSLDYMRAQCRQAMQTPAYQNTFRRLHLNQWTSQESRWLDMAAWDGCSAVLPDLRGRVCYGGLDLASTTDIAALALAFPPLRPNEPIWLLLFFWIPKENMIERVRRDRVAYDLWAQQGLVEATPGNVIDYGYIERRIGELTKLYKLKEIAFDPWNATQVAQNLSNAGVTMIEMRQGMASMAAPTKEFNRLVLCQGLAHGGNLVLRWMADNVVVKSDAAGNLKPDKGMSRQRIDGIVASIMALDRLSRNAGKKESVYKTRGLRVLGQHDSNELVAVTGMQREALEYVRNTQGNASVARFIEDFDPVGAQLWKDLIVKGLVIDVQGVSIVLTTMGRKVLESKESNETT